jgi:hypothetical protein
VLKYVKFRKSFYYGMELKGRDIENKGETKWNEGKKEKRKKYSEISVSVFLTL